MGHVHMVYTKGMVDAWYRELDILSSLKYMKKHRKNNGIFPYKTFIFCVENGQNEQKWVIFNIS